MADEVKYFDKVKLIDGSYAEVRDTAAREAIKGGTHFLGVTTTEITDGASVTSVSIGEETKTVANGDIIVYGNKEFIYAEADSKWHELGDTTGLGALALKNSVSSTYAPAGSVSKPDVTVNPTKNAIKEVDDPGEVTAGTANVPTQVTLPQLVTTLNGTTLELNWTDGNVTPGTANVPTRVTLPTTKNTNVVTDVEAELAAAPEFTGTQTTIVSE